MKESSVHQQTDFMGHENQCRAKGRIAYSGGKPVRALMSGIVRGMLQPGVNVTIGMKCGDIDARCEEEYCYTISDKARAIGGGVLEAIMEHFNGEKHTL